MATKVSVEGSGPSYASVLNFGGVESNKENIESTEIVGTPPRHEDEGEEGFVPVVSHARRPAKSRKEREKRAAPRPPKAAQAHTEPQPAEQPASTEAQPKKFVEAPIPKVNPWQVRGGSTGVPPPAPPAIHDTEKRSPLLPHHQHQPRPVPVALPVVAPAVATAVPEPIVVAPAAAPAPKPPTVVKAAKNAKVNQKVRS
ncbi:unnamed protein product [Leptosia nina]|uniref:Uncharacterized protein n=1 Tax=Leptosia nina TaxID=320188 RepID=A0AAV1JUZ8_9NEOP